ncbi:hypothetical protein ACUW6H_000004 [Streptococcus sp. 151470009-6]
MPKKNLNLDDVMVYIKKLPFTQFKSVIEHYSNHPRQRFLRSP